MRLLPLLMLLLAGLATATAHSNAHDLSRDVSEAGAHGDHREGEVYGFSGANRVYTAVGTAEMSLMMTNQERVRRNRDFDYHTRLSLVWRRIDEVDHESGEVVRTHDLGTSDHRTVVSSGRSTVYPAGAADEIGEDIRGGQRRHGDHPAFAYHGDGFEDPLQVIRKSLHCYEAPTDGESAATPCSDRPDVQVSAFFTGRGDRSRAPRPVVIGFPTEGRGADNSTEITRVYNAFPDSDVVVELSVARWRPLRAGNLLRVHYELVYFPDARLVRWLWPHQPNHMRVVKIGTRSDNRAASWLSYCIYMVELPFVFLVSRAAHQFPTGSAVGSWAEGGSQLTGVPRLLNATSEVHKSSPYVVSVVSSVVPDTASEGPISFTVGVEPFLQMWFDQGDSYHLVLHRYGIFMYVGFSLIVFVGTYLLSWSGSASIIIL
jgi:hypothetical protein